MIVHRIATRHLSSEAFLSNFITTSLCVPAVERVIDQPLLKNGDAMEERRASFGGYALLQVIRMLLAEGTRVLLCSPWGDGTYRIRRDCGAFHSSPSLCGLSARRGRRIHGTRTISPRP